MSRSSLFAMGPILAAALLAMGLGGCASAHLRTANGAANLAIAGLANTTAAYDAALTTQVEQSSLVYWAGPSPAPITRREFAVENADSVRYRTALATLRRHATLTNDYFTSLQEYTAPGANSATKHTDAQLAQSTGIASAIKALNPEFGAISNTVITLALNSIADARLRRHLEENGQSVATALLIQQGAMEALAVETALNRRQICAAQLAAFERTAAAESAQRRGRMTAAQVQALNEGRRTATACVREGTEAEAAARALADARRAYIALLEGRLDPNTAALVIDDVTRATAAISTYLHRPASGEQQNGS